MENDLEFCHFDEDFEIVLDDGAGSDALPLDGSADDLNTPPMSDASESAQPEIELCSNGEKSDSANPDVLDKEDYCTQLSSDVKTIMQELNIIRIGSENVSARLNELSQLFESRILHTEHEDKIVDQMHSELQKYKNDLYAQLVRPILLDIIETRNSILRMAATYKERPEGKQDIPNEVFSGYALELQDILEKNNVEVYRSQPGDDFTAIRQRAVKRVPTSAPDQHGKIAETLSCGYNYNGRTVSAEKVTVYYYEKSEDTNNPETAR